MYIQYSYQPQNYRGLWAEDIWKSAKMSDFKACLLCTVMGAFPVTACPSILKRLAKECHSKQCFIHHLDDERNKSSHFYSSNRSILRHSGLRQEIWSETLRFTDNSILFTNCGPNIYISNFRIAVRIRFFILSCE